MIFNKIRIGKFSLRNRVVVSPMCQYSAKNGSPTKWHYYHLLKLISSGASMLMMESTAVNKIGKITHQKKWKKSVYQLYKEASINDAWTKDLSLECKKNLISIKATTTEKLGFTGQGKGIAAQAVVLLRGKN